MILSPLIFREIAKRKGTDFFHRLNLDSNDFLKKLMKEKYLDINITLLPINERFALAIINPIYTSYQIISLWDHALRGTIIPWYDQVDYKNINFDTSTIIFSDYCSNYGDECGQTIVDIQGCNKINILETNFKYLRLH